MKHPAGFTLVEIMIVAALIGLLAAIAIPSFMMARTSSQQKACIDNLRQIESAKAQWAMEAQIPQGTATAATSVNAYLKFAPACPAGGTYDYGTVGADATCSISGSKPHRLN